MLIRSRGLAALCLGLCLPLTAFAQNVTFTNLARGPYGGRASAGNAVARTSAQASAEGLWQLLPIGGHIDWDTEMVLAVFMGTRNTGGYGIEIERIVLRPLPPPPVGAPVNPMHFMDVIYRETTPAPGSFVTMAITQPYHMVKVAKDPMAIVRFVPATAANRPFDELTRARRFGAIGGNSSSMTVKDTGEVELFRLNPPTTISGQASEAEMRDLRQAVRGARLDTLPADLSPNQSPPFVPDTTSYSVTGGAQDGAQAGGWTGLFDPAYAQRLAPVDAALDAIRDRLQAQPAPAAFEQVTLDTEHAFGTSSQWPMTRRIEVGKDGAVRVLKTHPTALFAPIAGQATQAELDALTAAVRGGDLANVPSPLPVAVPMHLISRPFTLAVASQDPANASRISGQYGFYGQWAGRIGPVIATLEGIATRVELQVFPPSSLRGTVAVDAAGNVSLRDAQGSWDCDAAFADDLRKFEGRQVTVSGDVTLAATAPGAPLHGHIKVDAILDPVRQTTTCVVYGSANDPALMLGSIFQTAPLQRIEAFGRAARVLEVALGREIDADAWLFHDEAGRPTGAYLESIDGEARRYSGLTRGGAFTGFVRRGEAVKVERLSSSGRFALVDGPHGDGYMRVDRLTIGRPLPAITPSPQPFGGAGMTSALGAASGN